jgi:hypothetical protein
MKSKLLLGSAVLATLSAFAQQPVMKNSGAESFDVGPYLARKFEAMRHLEPKAATQVSPEKDPVYGPEMDPSSNARSAAAIAAPASWKAISQSMNIYGVVVSGCKPLMYNDQLNTVSFVHRKAPNYVPNPFPIPQAESGAIVGVFTDNWGTEWDTTLLWNDDVNWGRYPQGGIYNITGAKCLFDSAYMIATGPLTTNASIWSGSYLASKQLDTMGGPRNNDSVSPNISANVFATNSGTNLPYGKFDFPSLDFATTDDGRVRTLGVWVNNYNGSGAAFGFRGAAVITGTFISGSFAWRSDSIEPDVLLNSSGSPQIFGTPHMAWNESGTVGYVWFVGVRDTTGLPDSMSRWSNFGYQPIVYKTTNSGATWSELPKINFNTETGAFNEVFRHMNAVENDSFGVPYFNPNEEMDGIVDRNDRLHIVSTIFSGSSKHPDSLNYIWTYNNADGERYFFRHTPKMHPYIYDFTETGNGWKVTMIDSLSSEAPGTTNGSDGYGDNPWDPSGGPDDVKTESSARIQLSRTPDGKYIVYTYAESDTGLTFLSHKWNSIPNVKARLAEIGVETSTAVPASITIHPLEINVTNPTNTVTTPPYTLSNSVKDKGSMHFISSRAAIISNPAALPNVAIGLPITITNSNGFKQYQANTHYYLSANLNFGNVSSVDWPVNECIAPKDTTTNPGDTTTVHPGIAERTMNISNSKLFPNPATNSAQLSITLENGSDVSISILNTMGQVVSTVQHKGAAGANTIDLHVANLASGVYMVNIKVGEATGTKRLLIQH